MIIILTGAGISQESGISTFRDSGGLWENERIEDVGTPGGFARDRDKVLNFYNGLRKKLLSPEISPNPAHLALARLEEKSTEPVLVITQNIDNLHERAGTKNLLHMHGELCKARCNTCNTVMQWENDMTRQDICWACNTIGQLRPHIVWFEEMPLHMDEIGLAFSKCRLFVSIGTSGHVYPAAGFVNMALQAGAETLELNLERSLGAWLFHGGRYGKAGAIVPAWVDDILAGE